MLAVSFLPQIRRFSADFWASQPMSPDRRHSVATSPPQIWTGRSCAGNQALARIEFSPVG
jgi:hypothetical protein